MDCEKLRSMLDAYIDGDLSAEEERAIREHAQACEACREELAAVELLRDALMHMDDDIAVPLEAQAAWRKAVRAEAKRKTMRRITRIAGGIAAALVLVVGINAALRNPEAGVGPEIAVVEGADALIAADGIAAKAVYTPGEENYTAWKKISTGDYEAALSNLSALAEEYSGTFSVQADEGLGARECICRIELPCDYLEDFLSAASRIGTELDSGVSNAQAETAVVSIQLFEAGQE